MSIPFKAEIDLRESLDEIATDLVRTYGVEMTLLELQRVTEMVTRMAVELMSESPDAIHDGIPRQQWMERRRNPNTGLLGARIYVSTNHPRIADPGSGGPSAPAQPPKDRDRGGSD
jgi:hypothetical protein